MQQLEDFLQGRQNLPDFQSEYLYLCTAIRNKTAHVERLNPSDWRCFMLQNHLSRLWFLSQGCKQVPPEFIGEKILWAHPDGYFLGVKGQKNTHGHSRSHREKQTKRGYCPPTMTHFGGKICHVLMALAFYGPRPIYSSRNGKAYVGQVHHLINDPLNYKPANLLCWLDRPTHREADRRRRILEREIGDLHQLSYNDLRRLEDPRITPTELFNQMYKDQ